MTPAQRDFILYALDVKELDTEVRDGVNYLLSAQEDLPDTEVQRLIRVLVAAPDCDETSLTIGGIVQ